MFANVRLHRLILEGPGGQSARIAEKHSPGRQLPHRALIGSGGFGITYRAEDINLKTTVALKEYYPAEFGRAKPDLSVRPKSERHKATFDWGRTSFLREAQTLARFRHPGIVRVTRVFEANATAYMVMDFEQGQSFEPGSSRSAGSRRRPSWTELPHRCSKRWRRCTQQTCCIATSRRTTS